MTLEKEANTPVVAGVLEALASGRVRVVDLTNRLSADTPTLTLPEPFANLIDFSIEEVSAFDDKGPLWRHNNIHTGEHIGTHLDAPRHWISNRDGSDVADIPVSKLVGPACVVDITDKVAADVEYLLTVKDLQAWESAHGTLPAGGWLLVRTGWDQHSQDESAFLNAADGTSRTPGISSEAARWLAQERPIAGYGVETVGIDAGNAFILEPPMPAHHFLLEADKYGITSLQNLSELPATGAMVVVSPLPIVGGTGSPARVLALVEA